MTIGDLPVALRERVEAAPLREFAAGAQLLEPGQHASEIWCIESGLVRLYSLGEQGLHRNHGFHGPGEWALGSLAWRDGRLCCAEVALGIEALKETRARRIALADLDEWRREEPAIAHFVTEQLLQLASQRIEREAGLLQQSAEQRYLALLAKQPALVEQIPQHHIAAWLGITPVALSRIRRRLRDAR